MKTYSIVFLIATLFVYPGQNLLAQYVEGGRKKIKRLKSQGIRRMDS